MSNQEDGNKEYNTITPKIDVDTFSEELKKILFVKIK